MKSLVGTRVLLVEDEPIIAMDHADRLARAGAEVIGPVPASGEAMRILEETAVDVAVIDYVLSDRNSAALQEELKRKHVPFVVVTAYPRILVRRDANQRILSKPVTSDELCASVQSACQQGKQRF
jgi:DNA-binding NarL/FixJ family response regulator